MHMPTHPVPTSISDGRSWILPIVLLIMSWAASSLVGFYHNDVALTNRITAIETQERLDGANEKERLDRIENKLDHLFYEMTGKQP